MARKPTGKHIVYRYVDETDNTIKYVGITAKDGLQSRIRCHKSQDDWKLNGAWRIECFECENKSEAEAFESHLIALYGTDKYYNKMKAGWGLNQYLPDIEGKWEVVSEPCFADADTVKVAQMIRELIRLGYRKEALELLDCIEFEED